MAGSDLSQELRVLHDGKGLPAANMAVDEALLRIDGPPTLRFYGWSPPGLSIGWFQEAEWFRDVAGPHHLVRRLTGGGAIYHQHEITFCLTAPSSRLPSDVAASYDLIHEAWRRVLVSVGVATTLLRGVGPPQGPRPDSPWCFAAPADHDLVLDATGGKLLGSAQRRVRQPTPRVLHHGSLVLRAPPAPAGCAAVADVTDPDGLVPELERSFAAELARALGLRLRRVDRLSRAELAQAAAARPRYLKVGAARRSSR